MSTAWNPNDVRDHIKSLKPSIEISPNDTMFGGGGHYYFGVGRSALVVIISSLLGRLAYFGGDGKIETVLDFGSGYGRVARYLRVAFPHSRIEVTDYDPQGPRWCVENLGCFDMPKDSTENRYDLVWLGSVFTHLPEQAVKELLLRLEGMLAPLGVLVFTMGGRLALENLSGYLDGRTDQRYTNFNMEDKAIREIISGWHDRGYGYSDYHNQKGYGSALAQPQWVQAQMENTKLLQIHFQEMGWDTQQDVYAYLSIPGSRMALAQRKGAYL